MKKRKIRKNSHIYYLCRGVALCVRTWEIAITTESNKKKTTKYRIEEKIMKTNELPYVCVNMCSFILLNYIFRVANIYVDMHIYAPIRRDKNICSIEKSWNRIHIHTECVSESEKPNRKLWVKANIQWISMEYVCIVYGLMYAMHHSNGKQIDFLLR